MMNNMMVNNMANVMAEDTGLYELRNPKVSGMRAKGWIARLITLIRCTRAGSSCSYME